MDVGCQVLMPWAAPIGQGPRNARALCELRQRAPNTPLIVDAGIGPPLTGARLWNGDPTSCS